MELIHPSSDSEWDAEVARHPAAQIFHGSAWARVLECTYGHRRVYRRLSENNATNALVPMAEVRSWLTGRRGVCLPFTDSCDALVFSPTPTMFPKLCDLGRDRRWKYLELRGKALVPPEAIPSSVFCGHNLDLTRGIEQVRAGFSKSAFGAVKKAQASGLQTEISGAIEAVRTYYQLHVRTRRRQGLPPQPWRFFANLQKFVLADGFGFVVLAKVGTRAVAGAIFLHAGRTALYKFSAADQAYQSMRPSNLIMDTAIDHITKLGCMSLDFGRTPMTNHGLRQFKRAWGPTEQEIAYYRFDLAKRKWTTSPDRLEGVHNAFFRRMPLSFNRAAGALLYPHLD